MKTSISLELGWIPRSENGRADSFSRIIDFDDWGISFEVLNSLQDRFGQFEIDYFASEDNAKLPIFYSRFWNPSPSGVVLMLLRNFGEIVMVFLFHQFQLFIEF